MLTIGQQASFKHVADESAWIFIHEIARRFAFCKSVILELAERGTMAAYNPDSGN